MSGLNLDRLPGQYAEDSAHTDGDRGGLVFGVRNDAGTALSGDGDYTPFSMDDSGNLRVSGSFTSNVADDAPDTENPIKVGTRASFGSALSAISADGDKANMISDEYRRIYNNDSFNVGLANQAISLDDTVGGTELKSGVSRLSGRRWLIAQNRGNQSIWVGATGVTAANGIEVDKKSSFHIQLGEEVGLFAIANASQTEDVRVLAAG